MKRRVAGLIINLWLPATALLVWWIASSQAASIYFPPLQTILVTFQDTWLFERFGSDVLPSLYRFAIALIIAVVIGVGLGTVLGLMPTLRRAVDPILDFFRALPKPAILPLAILFFGVDDGMKIFIIAFGTTWPILLSTIDGVKAVDPLLLSMSRIYGLSRGQQITQIVLPSAGPQIFVGARIAISIGLILVVISEMVASTNGLGYFVLLSQQTFAIPEMWSGIILLGIIGYLINVLFVLVEKRVLAWHTGWRAIATGGPAPKSRKLSSRVSKTAPAVSS